MIAMISMLRDSGINVIARPSFIDEDTGINYIEEFLIAKESEAKQREDEENPDPEEPKSLFAGLFSEDSAELRTSKKKKYKQHLGKNTPRNILIIDDNSHLTRNPSVFKLMQKNRHYSCKVFILCHFITCLTPGAINQLDYAIIFPGQSADRIKELHDKLGICDKRDTRSVPYLQKMYDEATAKKYNFLKIDVQSNKFWHNFDKQLY
jgi:hypothetical protein